MESELSLLCPQEPATGSYHKPAQSTPQPPILPLYVPLYLYVQVKEKAVPLLNEGPRGRGSIDPTHS
jgi:hypothetical protein